jgi:hypothetical protein
LWACRPEFSCSVAERLCSLALLAEKRNVHWDGASTRLVNGAAMRADQETWLPAASAAAPVADRIDFPRYRWRMVDGSRCALRDGCFPPTQWRIIDQMTR